MSRTFKSLVIALSGAGLFASAAGDAQACHPRHRSGGGHARVVYVRPPQQYPQQVYQQPIQQQPFAQQQLGQPGFVQGQNGQVGVQFQGQQQAQFQGQQFQGQQFQGQQFQGQATSASASAISALGGGVSGTTAPVQQQFQTQAQPQYQTQQQYAQPQFQQQAQRPVQQQAQQVQAQPQQQVQAQPQQQVQAQPQQQVQAQPQVQAQAQAQTSEQNAQTMALEALSGLDSTEAVPTSTQASQPAQPGLTGDYSASLQSLGATIRLSLNADGSFAWVVTTKDGKTSNFQGRFTTSGGNLTLARTDNTKLEASVTPTATGFSLKMVGQNATPLSFVRV